MFLHTLLPWNRAPNAPAIEGENNGILQNTLNIIGLNLNNRDNTNRNDEERDSEEEEEEEN